MSTFQALFVALLAVLPGALYTLARENFGASWAWQQTDTATQIFRFLGASAVFHVLFAPLSYWAYQNFVANRVAENAAKGESLSWWWWAALAGYVILPYILGALTESSRSWRPSSLCLIRWPQALLSWLLSLLAGRNPAPRAWDFLFSAPDLGGYIRLKLIGDRGWKAGLWVDSYASGFGVDPDLYIGEEIAISDDGEVVFVEEDGQRLPELLGRGLLIRWSEVQYLDFMKFDAEGEG